MKVSQAIIFLTFFPLYCFAAGPSKNIHFFEEVLSFVNLAVLITSIISIKQFFFPGEKNMTPFQIFNIIFIVIFYIISLTFLIHNKEYYPGFEQLSPLDCIKKIFFDWDTSTIKQWVIILGLIINIIYIARNGKDAYYA